MPRLQTNLVVIDNLLEIFEKPGDFFVVLDMVGKAEERRLLVQQSQRFPKSLERTGSL